MAMAKRANTTVISALNQDSMITGNKVILRDKSLSDVRNDYAWQTDPELAFLDATMTMDVSFAEYLLDYAQQIRNTNHASRRFAVTTLEGKLIGNCSYYHIDEASGEAEVGIMIGDRDYWDKGYGTDAVIALLDYIFRQTDLRRVYLKTLDWNLRAQRCFQKSGFSTYGYRQQDGNNFVLMEMTRPQWQKLNQTTDKSGARES